MCMRIDYSVGNRYEDRKRIGDSGCKALVGLRAMELKLLTDKGQCCTIK